MTVVTVKQAQMVIEAEEMVRLAEHMEAMLLGSMRQTLVKDMQAREEVLIQEATRSVKGAMVAEVQAQVSVFLHAIRREIIKVRKDTEEKISELSIALKAKVARLTTAASASGKKNRRPIASKRQRPANSKPLQATSQATSKS